MRVLFLVALVVGVVGVSNSVAGSAVAPQPATQVAGPQAHDPPVDAVVIDPFRPPQGLFAPGNRGLEYDTTPGQVVRASNGGTVTFSGQVGGNLFVTIQHDAELRTTVGFVDEVLVAAGDSVRKGDAVAVAGHTMHFTARRNGAYFDPVLLFQQYRVVVRLVGDPTAT